MKNKFIFNYFSKIALILIAIIFCSLNSKQVNAQMMSFGGKQIFEFGSEICDSPPEINVHFILNGGRITSLYDSPTTLAIGDSEADVDVNQIGKYLPVPMTCMMSIDGAPVPIWVTDGIYYQFDGAVGDAPTNTFFAGVMSPFVKAINLNS